MLLPQNLIIDEIIETCLSENSLPHPASILNVASNLDLESPIGVFFVDIYVRGADSEELRTMIEWRDMPAAFIGEVLIEKAAVERANPNMKVKNVFRKDFVSDQTCHYHMHNDDRLVCGEGCVVGR